MTTNYVNIIITFQQRKQPHSHVTNGMFTLPEQTPYAARAPAQQKQNPGGFVRALAEYLQIYCTSVKPGFHYPS